MQLHYKEQERQMNFLVSLTKWFSFEEIEKWVNLII